MYQGNHSRYSVIVERRRVRKQKRTALIAALVMVGVLLVGGTVAWMTSSTNSVINTFKSGSISTEVDEEIDGGVKSNVSVKNTGSVEAYIRANIVVNWVDGGGNIIAEKPREGAGHDYTMTVKSASPATSTNWFVQGGYYYWPAAVAPDGSTGILIEVCELTEAGKTKAKANGYKFKVDVIASGIQTVPTSVVVNEWKVGVSNGVLVPNVSDAGTDA